MLTRINCFIFLFVLQYPPSLPLSQLDAVSTSKANNLLEQIKGGSIEQITPNILKVTGVIQQIDVKDVANQVISNINNVVIDVESKDKLIPGLHNQLKKETQANALNPTANVTNTLIDELNTVSNVTEINGNVTSSLVLNTTSNVASLNNNVSSNLTEADILLENVGNRALKVESLTLKPPGDTPNTIIDVKFRRSGYQNQENTDNKDAATNNSSLESSPANNATLANSNNTVVENPAFRMLLQDKLGKLKQVSNIVAESNANKDLNFVLKLLPKSLPLNIDLNQLPLNNVIGDAFNFVKRLKRQVDEKETNPLKSNCKFKQIDGHKVMSCKETKDLTASTRKSLNDSISKILKLYKSDHPLCPLAVTVKLYAQQVLDTITNNNPDRLLNQILTSFLRGDEDSINLVTMDLTYVPVPVKLRLQLLHGNTKEFIEELSDIIDSTLCFLQ